MELFSGRFDILPLGEVVTVEKFVSFLNKYTNCDTYLVTREDKEKDGVTPTKVHFHFLFNSNKKHDTLRAKLSDLGWKGSLASLSTAIAPPKRTLEKTYHYVLKQGNVIHVKGIDNIEELKEQSKMYNDGLTLNSSFSNHFMKHMLPDMRNKGLKYRGDIIRYIVSYCIQFNENEEVDPLKLPNQSEMLKFIQIYEMKTHKADALMGIIEDYRSIGNIWKTEKMEIDYLLVEENNKKKQKLLDKLNQIRPPIVEVDSESDSELSV